MRLLTGANNKKEPAVTQETFNQLNSLWEKSIKGKLFSDGASGDGKREFVTSTSDDGWEILRIEIDTDDCDSQVANASKNFLIALWNAWPEIQKHNQPKP